MCTVIVQCPAGKVGTCSHTYAMMKLVAKWVLEKYKLIPEPEACTSKACEWSVPQSRNWAEIIPVADINIVSPANKHKENRKGIKTTLYDARAETTRQETASTLDAILNSGTSNHAIGIINHEPIHFTNTLYGTMPWV